MCRLNHPHLLEPRFITLTNFAPRGVGAFVFLYPYGGSDANRNRFVEAIAKVGVGGVPFLPSSRAEVTDLLKRIIAISAEAVEDTSVELSTVDERQRVEWAHQYGLVAIVPTPQQLGYILREAVYHTPYDQHRKMGLTSAGRFYLVPIK